MITVTGHSQSAKSYANSGLAKHKLTDYTGAIADFTKAIEIDSMYADAYAYRGYSKNMMRDSLGAIHDFTMAIAIQPDYADA